jgi:hypothetical protein
MSNRPWGIFMVWILLGGFSHYFDIRNNVLTLYLKVPAARQVEFVSSLDDYQTRNTRKTDADTWVVEVPADVEFKYFYRVDGRVFLPSCRLKEKDDFGLGNCIYTPAL